jgi:hypothetical protein
MKPALRSNGTHYEHDGDASTRGRREDELAAASAASTLTFEHHLIYFSLLTLYLHFAQDASILPIFSGRCSRTLQVSVQHWASRSPADVIAANLPCLAFVSRASSNKAYSDQEHATNNSWSRTNV